MPHKLPSLSAFFPAFNEEPNIAPMVKNLDEACRMTADKYEIIIVDDGSKDYTKEVAEKLRYTYPSLRVISHKRNLGYGAAVRTGLTNCNMEYIFYTDGDRQFDARELSKFATYCPEYKIVLGYRNPRRDSLQRRLFGWGWSLLMRLLFGIHARDVDCAFKLFHRSVLDNVTLHARGAMVSAELLTILHKKKIPFKQMGVAHYPRLAGEQSGANVRVIQRAIRELIKLYPQLKRYNPEERYQK